MATVSFIDDGIAAQLKNKKAFRQLLIEISRNEGVEFEHICFIFSTDKALLKLNKQFLKHDTYTDVVTFTFSEKNIPMISDIYISIERIKENSKMYNVSYLNELNRIMIHGILHLCGLMDHTLKTKAQMRLKENFYLKKLGFT